MNARPATIPERRRLTWVIPLATLNVVLGFCASARGQDFNVPLIIPLTHQYLFNPEMAPSITVQLSAVDLNTPSDELVWSDLSYAGGWGKDPTYPDISAITDPTMNSAGLLQWNLAGWKDGFHFLNAIVTNSRNNRSTASTLALTVQIAHVPEPTSATCVIGAGLSILGLARLGRIARNHVNLRAPIPKRN